MTDSAIDPHAKSLSEAATWYAANRDYVEKRLVRTVVETNAIPPGNRGSLEWRMALGGYLYRTFTRMGVSLEELAQRLGTNPKRILSMTSGHILTEDFTDQFLEQIDTALAGAGFLENLQREIEEDLAANGRGRFRI